MEVLRRRIRPGTRIISDCCLGYIHLADHIPELDLTHYSVNHSENFVSPEDREIHRQTIESFWLILKRFLRKKASTRIGKTYETYYDKILFRKKANQHFLKL